MEHKPIADLSRVADVHPVPLRPVMSRRERLERWAEVLEREPMRLLKSLEEIEWRSSAERLDIRADGSPLTVAFEDPVLRAEGLASDRLGDASAFFGLSHPDQHFVLCSCVHGRSMTADQAASRVRGLISGEPGLRGLMLISGSIVALLMLSSLLNALVY
jgi:hypothetical protein